MESHEPGTSSRLARVKSPQVGKARQHTGTLPARLGSAVEKLVAQAQFVGTEGLGADIRNRVIVAVANRQASRKVESN